ncbi:MAG TPA: orotidine-5'-phosphate decarboxylase [Actinomycetota bacterium]|nr:orotidine-5'-phosphate decarboxylase [Actinomycetota bacterium]
MTDPRLCVALDVVDADALRRVAEATAEHVDMFKIGSTAFVAHGPSIVRDLGALRPVFLDLKLHDIPAQVAGAVRAAAATGARLLTVHASGGPEMVEAAVAAAPAGLDIAAVMVLTSLDDAGYAAVGGAWSIATAMERLSDQAVAAGASALVCSPLELAALRARHPQVTLIVPGIRPRSGSDDQKRTGSPRDAVASGADLLVVGRPITAAADPGAAAREIAAEMRSVGVSG